MNQHNQQNEPERSFESLNFYQDSLKLLKASYRLAGDLPNYERYNRACSITSSNFKYFTLAKYIREPFFFLSKVQLKESYSLTFILVLYFNSRTDSFLRTSIGYEANFSILHPGEGLILEAF